MTVARATTMGGKGSRWGSCRSFIGRIKLHEDGRHGGGGMYCLTALTQFRSHKWNVEKDRISELIL